MLALETGWLPSEIASLPARFRAACHHVLYVRTLIPDGLPDLQITKDMSVDQRLAIGAKRAHGATVRAWLFPDDE